MESMSAIRPELLGNNHYCDYPDLVIWMYCYVPLDNHPPSPGRPLIAFSSQKHQINDCLQPFTVSFTQKYTKEADNSEIESVGVGDVPTLPFVSVVWRHDETYKGKIH